MALKDRLKGILRDAYKRLNPAIARAKYQLGINERVDPTHTGKRILDIESRSHLPVSSIRSSVHSIVPELVEPFSAKFRYDSRIGGYREVKTGVKRDRSTYLNALSNHKDEVLKATIAQKNPNLRAKDINRAVKLLKERREQLRDIQGDLSINEYRERYREQWEELKDEFGIVTP